MWVKASVAVVLCVLSICRAQRFDANATLFRILTETSAPATARPKQVYYHAAHKKKVPADADGTKYMALTFDDGPHQTLTPRLLDILKDKKAKATFYVMGVKVVIHPEIVSRASVEGHEIGNHVYDHPVLTKIKPQVWFAWDIQATSIWKLVCVALTRVCTYRYLT